MEGKEKLLFELLLSSGYEVIFTKNNKHSAANKITAKSGKIEVSHSSTNQGDSLENIISTLLTDYAKVVSEEAQQRRPLFSKKKEAVNTPTNKSEVVKPKRVSMTEEKASQIRWLNTKHGLTANQISPIVGVSYGSVYRVLKNPNKFPEQMVTSNNPDTDIEKATNDFHDEFYERLFGDKIKKLKK